MTETLSNPTTVISTESELIGGAAALAIGPDGRIYVLDPQFKDVLSVRPDGTDPRRFGGPGGGPGEFEEPTALSVGEEGFWVYDRRNSRVDAFDPDGAVRSTRPVRIQARGRGVALDGAGRLALATGGDDSTMVAILDERGSATASFGTPVVPAHSVFNLTAMKETVRRGGVPDEFRNEALLVWAQDGGLWLLLQTESEARRYRGDGQLLWSRTLEDPAFDAIREAFFEANRELEDVPYAIQSLRYFRDAKAVGGDLSVLLTSPRTLDASVILVLDGSDGSVRRRLLVPEVPNAGAFALDPERGRLYVANADDASLLAFPLDLANP